MSASKWFGSTRSDWNVTPLKHLVHLTNGFGFRSDEWSETGPGIIRIENLNGSQKYNRFDGPVDARHHVTRGDLLFAWSGNRGTSFGPHMWKEPGTWYLNQHIFRVQEVGVDRRWLYWALEAATRYIEQQTSGMIGMVHLTKEELGLVQIPVPPSGTQRAMADYLHAETARIDALITKKRRMIGLLQEKRVGEIRAVVSGCSDRSVALRHISKVKRGQSPRPIDDPQYFDDEGTHGWVRIEDVSRSGMYLRETRDRLSALGRSRSVPVGPGIVLVSIAATVGKPVVTDMLCCYHDGFVGLHDLRAVPEFIYYCLSLPESFGGLGNLGTQANINSEIVGRIRVPLCDRQTQSSAAHRIQERVACLDGLVATHNRQLDLLTEHREALITATVTGELSTRGVEAGACRT